MDSINAALLLVSLKHFNKKRKILKSISETYKAELDSSIQLQKYSKNEIPGRYAFPIIAEKRNQLKEYLLNHKIETKIWNDPLVSEAPVYKKQNFNDTPNAKRILDSSLNIPYHEKLSKEQVDYVIYHINKFVKNV